MAKKKEEKVDKWVYRHFTASNVFALWHINELQYDEEDNVAAMTADKSIIFDCADKELRVENNINYKLVPENDPLIEGVDKLLKNHEQLRIFVKIIFTNITYY